MVKCNGCGLAHQNESYVGRLHGGCKRDGSWELQSKGDMQGQQLAMANTSAQQAAMMHQSALAQQFNAQQSAAMNQVVESAAIQVLKKRIAELEAGDYVHGMIYRNAMSRIAELEKERDEANLRADSFASSNDMLHQGREMALKMRDEARHRANKLSDECGALKTQNTELLAENARLRRGGR